MTSRLFALWLCSSQANNRPGRHGRAGFVDDFQGGHLLADEQDLFALAMRSAIQEVAAMVWLLPVPGVPDQHKKLSTRAAASRHRH